ncbi:MAG: nucleotidyltransferase family protein [Oscillospiraceae bacterium]|jgi:CTP:molybdopterin cytidylyltransferase MocA|nr:nucleotidyltransferase family protein [Oscillospiraceae bacterium]
MSEYAAVILAAGYSSRMGALKPLLPIAGVPAVRRVADTVMSAGVLPVVVTGHRAEDVAGALSGSGAIVAENKSYGDGMFSSVRAGIRALPPEARAFFLLPADCCAVKAETLAALIREFSSVRGAPGGTGERIIYPTFGGKRGHPPLLPGGFAPVLLGYGGEGGAKGCMESLPRAELSVPDGGILLDMDTPRAYAEMLRFTGSEPDMSDAAAAALPGKYDTPPEPWTPSFCASRR